MRGGFPSYHRDSDGHLNSLSLETSSGSSSPNSSSSNEELHIVDQAETAMNNRAKPRYNFSIPDIIKHDRSSPAGNSVARVDSGATRMDQCLRHLKRHHVVEEEDPSWVVPRSRSGAEGITRNAKQRRTGTGASAGNFHPVIDLTTTPDSPDIQPIHLLDDANDVHSDSEVSVTGIEPSRRFESLITTIDDDGIEQVRRRLRETHQETQRFLRDAQSRLRRRRVARVSPRVITDGPVYSYSSINSMNNGGYSSSRRQRSLVIDDMEPPVINLEEDNIPNHAMQNQNVSAQMSSDPNYAQQYLPPLRNSRAANNIAATGDSPSALIHSRRVELSRLREQVNHFQQQVRERYEVAQARLQRLQYIVREQRHDVPYPLRRAPPQVNLENDNVIQEGSEDEVEIVHEWRRHQGSTNSSRGTSTEGNRGSALGNYGRLGRGTAIIYPHRLPGFPDFLLPVVLSPVPAPPLHHYPPGSASLLEGEDYEALWSLAERIGPAKPRGLCKAAISQIPSFRFSASNASDTNTTCVVCMCDYSNREKLRKLPCSHDFHSKCIDKWLKSNRTCPVCRDEVKAQ